MPDSRGGLPPGPKWRRLWAVAKPHVPALALASVFVLAGSAITLAAPRVAGLAVDAALLEGGGDVAGEGGGDVAGEGGGDVAGEGGAGLDRLAALLLALFAVRGALAFGENYTLRAAGGRMLRGLRDRVHGHLLSLDPRFYRDRPVGELLSRLGSDLERIQNTLTQRGPTGARAALTLFGAVAILFTLHGGLAGVALAMVPVVAGLSYFYGRRLQALATRTQDARGAISATAEEELAGLRAVQSFAAETSERERYGRELDRLLGIQLEAARSVGLYSGLLQFAGFSAFALVVWYGGRLIAGGGALTPGELTSSLIYTFAIASTIGPLGSLYAGLRELRGASARVFEILDETPAVADPPGAPALAPERGDLEIEGVAFAYPGSEEWALRGVDVTARRGEVVALVGPSGAGKSTLFALIQRFYDPHRGSIRIDGRDARDVSLTSLRRAVADVPQEVMIFSRSVADNIRLGRPGAARAEIERAAAAAGADAFIRELPDGYDTLVGERGARLSAGQRQRLAIARALVAEPALLLLDEATSALDPDSEALVQEALGRIRGELTTLLIAHRLATARRADRILFLDRGAVVAAGTHADLYEKSPPYRRYWELQAPAPPVSGGPESGPAWT